MRQFISSSNNRTRLVLSPLRGKHRSSLIKERVPHPIDNEHGPIHFTQQPSALLSQHQSGLKPELLSPPLPLPMAANEQLLMPPAVGLKKASPRAFHSENRESLGTIEEEDESKHSRNSHCSQFSIATPLVQKPKPGEGASPISRFVFLPSMRQVESNKRDRFALKTTIPRRHTTMVVPNLNESSGKWEAV